MEIRHAHINDLEEIMKIYEHARNFMRQHGNPKQWAERNWPPQSYIEDDIAKEKCFVCVENSQILGVFYFNYGYQIDPTYLVIEDGNWIGDDTYGVVHRIATNGTKGTGSFCIRWALEQCGHLRIDTHPDNYVMQNMLTKLGFTKCGIIYVVEDSDPRYAFELVR